MEFLRQWWLGVRRRFDERVKPCCTAHNGKSALLIGASVSVFYRRFWTFTLFLVSYMWTTVPDAKDFEKTFEDWFETVYFPKIVQEFQELWHNDFNKRSSGKYTQISRDVVMGMTSTIGNALGNLFFGADRNNNRADNRAGAGAAGGPAGGAADNRAVGRNNSGQLSSAAGFSPLSGGSKAPTLRQALRVVERYETTIVDWMLFKYCFKENAAWSAEFFGVMNRWVYFQGTAYEAGALKQVLGDIELNPK